MPAKVKIPSRKTKPSTNQDGLTRKEQEIANKVGAVGPAPKGKSAPNEYLYRFPEGQRVLFEKLLKKDCRNIRSGIEFLIWNYIRNHPSYDPSWEPEEDI